jgi:hypothetical protein
MIIAMNPKLSSPVTSKMMNQVLSWSPAVLIRADPERTGWGRLLGCRGWSFEVAAELVSLPEVLLDQVRGGGCRGVEVDVLDVGDAGERKATSNCRRAWMTCRGQHLPQCGGSPGRSDLEG